jgi:hypothetical protein
LKADSGAHCSDEPSQFLPARIPGKRPSAKIKKRVKPYARLFGITPYDGKSAPK